MEESKTESIMKYMLGRRETERILSTDPRIQEMVEEEEEEREERKLDPPRHSQR